MIVKIWPIKGSQGVERGMLYVDDDNKVIQLEKDEDGALTRRTILNVQQELHIDPDTYFIENEKDISRVLEYMANEKKTQKKYVSGFQCDPDSALTDFKKTWEFTNIERFNKADEKVSSRRNPENSQDEVLAFHMVQSFPEDLDISDEEIHQCGLELLQRLGKHQGIVCSHVHPVVDKDGKLHGRSKHNHILFNAYIEPTMIDPDHPEALKYHDCKDTYAQLRIWNDEIAIEHGLPIIRNPDMERTYSWTENYEGKFGRSWKERMRLDIEDARRLTNNWDEFKLFMERNGYTIREGAHVTFLAPDGKSKARGHTLGRQYTKESLQLYWSLRHHLEQEIAQAVKDNEAPPLWKIAQQTNEPLTVAIPLGNETGKVRSYSPLPLSKSERNRETLSTYFNDKDLYDIRNKDGRIIATATGKEIVDYLDALNRGHDEQWKLQSELDKQDEQQTMLQQEEERSARKQEEKQRQEYYYSQFRNSRTGKRYYVNNRDENGRHRSSIELVFRIAIVVLKNENGLWDLPEIPEGKENEAVFGPIDWKIQNMLDSIHIAEDYGIETPATVDQRLDNVGAALSRARSGLTNTRRSQEKMEALAVAIKKYDATYELVEKIQVLPEGPEKEELKEQYADLISDYKKAKAVMYGYKVQTRDEIEDFKIRYADIERNIPKMQEELDNLKEEYRQLKKLQYNMSLAQNAQYCYGPEYDVSSQEEREQLWQAVTEHEFEEQYYEEIETAEPKEQEKRRE